MSLAQTIRIAVVVGLLAMSMAARADANDTDVAPSDWLLIDLHAAAGLTCSACHGPSPPEPGPGFAACVACHGTMLDGQRMASTPGPDPHHSPHLGHDVTPECTSCHQVHRPSEVTCTMCHRAFRFDTR